ncbi:MAG TPA: prepilin-type N-terminal cleavage/methylation domain-containing protein [Fimbriimonadales bacterium]|nr:prepilin-type N-terminal cleavage/methylation domain-containing protein [Fimbriimonadales bacterium]
MRKQVNKFHSAFTLIELLVVIAIIAILAAILFPVFQRAKESAKRAACLTQAQQLGMAVSMYTDSHDGNYPMAANFGLPPEDPLRIWTMQVFPYVNNRQIFICPSTDGKFAADWATRGEMTIGFTQATAYDANGCDEGSFDPDVCEGFTTVASIIKLEEPSRVALFADTPGGPLSLKYRGYLFSPYNGLDNPNYPELGLPLISDRDLVLELQNLPPGKLKPIWARHQRTGRDDGFTNVIFGDGHAKGYSARMILAMENGANIIWRFRL